MPALKHPIDWEAKQCRFCDGNNPAAYLMRGTYFSHYHLRVIPFYGYVCEADSEQIDHQQIIASRKLVEQDGIQTYTNETED